MESDELPTLETRTLVALVSYALGLALMVIGVLVTRSLHRAGAGGWQAFWPLALSVVLAAVLIVLANYAASAFLSRRATETFTGWRSRPRNPP